MGKDIRIKPLGAGQDVGRSCIILEIFEHTLLLDCGMHLSYTDERQYPDFRQLAADGDYTSAITAVLISHYHLDHIGALPLLTETCGYRGPVVMSQPTQAVSSILLKDYRKIIAKKTGEDIFTDADVDNCLSRFTPIAVQETLVVKDNLRITAHYAGHVLGAVMFEIECRGRKVVYTGDFNTTPDRHLGPADIRQLNPDVLITESTFATTAKAVRRKREMEFVEAVAKSVSAGGKVLIPTFAVGKLQELALLLAQELPLLGVETPMYLSSPMAQEVNKVYDQYVAWASHGVKQAVAMENMAYLKALKPFHEELLETDTACIIFATPGMMTGGWSLKIFSKLAPDAKNLVVLPGYCVIGTVGHELQQGNREVKYEKEPLKVECAVQSVSFSAHAHGNGILRLIDTMKPAHVVLVHGEPGKMQLFKQRVEKLFSIPCSDPENFSLIEPEGDLAIPLEIATAVVQEVEENARKRQRVDQGKGKRYSAVVEARLRVAGEGTLQLLK